MQKELSLLERWRVSYSDSCDAVDGLTLDVPEQEMWQGACGYEFLKEEILPQMAAPPYGRIAAEKLSDRKPVYLFREETKNIMVVGKFCRHGSRGLQEAWTVAEREHFIIQLLRRRMGMDDGIYRVVRPLGKKKELGALLVTEWAPGRTLDHYIAEAIYNGAHQDLFNRLGHLAAFFAKLHRPTATSRRNSLREPAWYFGKLMESLGAEILEPPARNCLEEVAARWWQEDGIFAEDREVLVHGDATPCNFLFDGEGVTGIDLERSRVADRCWDLGFVTAELKHHFMWRMGDGWAAEPFIGHFLWEYAVRLGDDRFFQPITRRMPLYMALGLLRIARNSWLDEPHRRNLLREAQGCLTYGL